VTAYQTKDSGKREKFDSGMVRDTQEGKARFDLLIPEGVPYKDQMLTRFAELMTRGAGKYGERNWEKANGEVELARAKSSALRHMMQYIMGETDEDHAAAVLFNILEAETVRSKIERAEAKSVLNILSEIGIDVGMAPLAKNCPDCGCVLGDEPHARDCNDREMC